MSGRTLANPLLERVAGLLYLPLMDWQFDATTVSPHQQVSPWPQAVNKPDFADDVELKKLFAIELANGQQPLEAGLAVLGDTSKSVWASVHWIKDVEVLGFRDAYLSAKKSVEKPLDKEQLLDKILKLADERDSYGRPLVEAKERINALKLYSDISGFTGKVEIDNSTNNFSNKTVNLVMVKPQETKTIDHQNIKSEISNPNEQAPTIKLKLVGGASK